MFLEKSNPMKLNDLVEGQGRGLTKSGVPKNEGMSVDMYENKGRKFWRWESL